MDKRDVPAAIPIALKTAPPAKVDAGAQLTFSIVLKWPAGLERDGTKYLIRDGATVIQSGDLPWSEAEDGSIVFAATAPENIGEQRWLLTIAKPSDATSHPAEGSLPLAFATVPHETSLAVWDNPSPVVRNVMFEVKVGAKCTSSCVLAGRIVEVQDDTGKTLGSAPLGEAAWEGTASLYWTPVLVKAPRKLGLHYWSARFAPAETKLAHGSATARFSFVTVVAPEHSVTVKVVDTKTKAPVADAQVRIGLYRAVTDEKGAARVQVPKGTFDLIVTRAGYEVPERSIAVEKDLRIQIRAEQLPEEDPFAHWTA